jgi:ferredoxin-NADP reductase
MIRRLLARSPAARVHLLYVAARADHLLYGDEFAALQSAHPRFEIATAVIESGAAGLYPWLIEEVRRRWIDADADRTRHFYICGVGPRVLELRGLLRAAAYERRAVHYETW